MQRHNILLNRKLSTNGSVVNSGLDLENNYYVYTQNLGGGLTNAFNVRAYLNDPQNQLIIDQFIAYIKDATTEAEFLEIFYDDTKLKSVFNKFFESQLQGQPVSVTAEIDKSLANTISIVVINNNFKWEGESTTKSMTGLPESILDNGRVNSSSEQLVSTTSEDSYYIPVKLNFTHNQLPREKFKVCDDYIDARLSPIEYFLASQGLTDIQSGQQVETFLKSLAVAQQELFFELTQETANILKTEVSDIHGACSLAATTSSEQKVCNALAVTGQFFTPLAAPDIISFIENFFSENEFTTTSIAILMSQLYNNFDPVPGAEITEESMAFFLGSLGFSPTLDENPGGR